MKLRSKKVEITFIPFLNYISFSILHQSPRRESNFGIGFLGAQFVFSTFLILRQSPR